MYRVLITGGAGFIGFHLARFLANRDYKVVIYDNLFRGKMDKELKELCAQANVTFINCDLTDREELKRIKEEFDYVYHFAAINGTRYFYEIPHEVLRVNVLSLINMLEWSKGGVVGKFLFASSSEVYAGMGRVSQLPIPTPENVPLIIDDPYNSRLSYAGSKIIGELFLISYSKAYDFPATIVRYHNIYGPRMGYEHVIPEFCIRILKKENPFKIYGGKETRAFCYIDDAVMATKLVMETEKTNREIIHIGNPQEEITILDLTKKMFDLFDYHPSLEILPASQGSINRRCPKIDKLVSLTGFSPTINLEEGLIKTFVWYKKVSNNEG